MKRNTRKFLLIVLFLTALLNFLNSNSTFAQLDVFKIAIDQSFAPFESRTNGGVEGFDIELMNEMATQLQVDVEYYPMLWDDVMESVNNNSMDMFFGADTLVRREKFDFSIPILNFTWRIFVRKEVLGISSVSDLSNHTVGVVENYASHEYLRENFPSIHLVLLDNIEHGLNMVANNEIFAFFGVELTGKYYIQFNELIELKVIGEVTEVGPFSIAVKKSNHELLNQINISLIEMFRSGDYFDLYDKWFGFEVQIVSPKIIQWVIITATVVAIGISSLLLWNYTLKKRIQEKTRELEQSMNLLIKQDKIESIGILAAGIAHDFNNLLMAILGGITLIKSHLSNNKESLKGISEVENAALRARDLSNQLLTFSKGGTPMKKACDIKDLIMQSANFTIHGTKTKCRFIFPEENPKIEVDPGQISQVINNLTVNGIQAMKDGGTIEIEMAIIQITTLDSVPLPKGRYIKISFSDNGVGIPKEMKPKIFTPFFTTKSAGSGLGLTTSYSIIKKHHGYIDFVSELGIGTTFFVFLPFLDMQFQNKAHLERKKPLKGYGNVLVMDDESSVRKVVKKMLKSLGYKTTLTSNGLEAIVQYQKNMKSNNPFELVILDITIPGGMGGIETLKKLIGFNPNVRIILSTGYTSEIIDNAILDSELVYFLKKPYTMNDLASAISQILH